MRKRSHGVSAPLLRCRKISRCLERLLNGCVRIDGARWIDAAPGHEVKRREHQRRVECRTEGRDASTRS